MGCPAGYLRDPGSASRAIVAGDERAFCGAARHIAGAVVDGGLERAGGGFAFTSFTPAVSPAKCP